jgi:DNA-binding PadR family transcriptional regulator
MARLLVLWILSERASYGYEIKKALTDGGTAFWFGLDDTSIYSALRTLVKHGYAREVGIEQPGARPPRTRYEITAAGRRHYRELLIEALATPRPPTAPIDVALAAHGDLDEATVRAALDRRNAALSDLEAGIHGAAAAAPGRAIVDRHLAAVRAEREWLARLDPATIT